MEPTERQLNRGTSALEPFVRAWNLPLNPEQLDLMAYAVLSEADGQWNEAAWVALNTRVEALIAEDHQAHQQMLVAWQAEIDQRSARQSKPTISHE
jgi:hypothetical protein